MSSIHYKFRATLEYKTLQFDGLSILGGDLKREICSKENIKAEAFDLILQNAHTKRQYNSDEQIPRNSSIIVQRVPKEDGEKLPKIQGVNMGMVTRGETSVDSGINVTGHIVQSEFDKLTEEERLAHIKDVSTSKFQPTNFQKRAAGPLTGPPPPTYTCNRCHQPGHWFKNCPLLNQKRTTGIPSQELMETTADDPLAMLHPSGKHVIPIMHWKARQHKKIVEETPVVERVPPPEFTCPLCGHLLKDAVLTTCCGNSFCAECIGNRLMESEDRQCPGEKCTRKPVSVEDLVPNKMVRQAVQAWQASGTPAEAQAQERIRIGILPSSNLPSTSSANALSAVGVTTVVTTTTTSVAVPTAPPVPAASAVLTAPGTSAPVSVPVSLPTIFSQPPPNMLASSLAPPGTTQMLPAQIPPLIPPPIPGIGMMAPMYNTGRPTLNVNSGPQFLHAWEAFLNRNDRSSGRDQDRNRDRKRRKRSRDRRSRSPSEDDRKRIRNGRGGRGATRSNRSKDNNHSNRDHDSRDSGRTKSRRHEDSSEEKSRRRKEKDYEERKKRRRSRSPKDEKHSDRDEPMDEEAAIDDALKEVEELNKRVLDSEDSVDVDVDMEAATCNRSEEEEDEKKEKDKDREAKEAEKVADVGDKTSSEYNTSPDVRKSSAEPEENAKKEAPMVESSDEKVRVRSSDSGTTHEEKTDVDEDKDEKKHRKHKHKRDHDGSESPKKEKKNKKHKKEKKHKKHREDETEEERKERKRLKKEKKEKKRREEEEEKELKLKARSDDKERKKSHEDDKHHHRRHKDEKEEKKHKDERKEKEEKHDRKEKRHEDEKERRKEKEEHHRKEEKEERHRDEKSKEDRPREEKSKEDRRREERSREEKQKDERHREDKGKEERHKEEKKDSEASKGSGDSKKLSKLERLSEAKTKESSGKPAVVDEKRIREHFSPPPTLLQHKKITLNI